MNTEHIEFTYIDRPETLREMIRFAENHKLWAVDTEADSLHHYFHKVCLLQICTGGEIFIVDPLALPEYMEELTDVMQDKLLIFHGGDYDLHVLNRDFGFVPDKIFDTMIAIQLLGYEKLGFADLVERHFGIKLSKGPQKMDWSLRPLPEKMLVYGAADVKYLPDLYRIIHRELEEKKRLPWLEESCRHLIENTLHEKAAEEESWRLKGSSKMSRLELAILRNLWLWREDEAQKHDVPVFKVMKNEWLLELACWGAANMQQPLTRFPHYKAVANWKSRAARLERALREARKLAAGKRPVIKKVKNGERRNVDPELLERLKAIRDRIAAQLELPPPVILNQKALSRLASSRVTTPEELTETAQIMNWQAELITKDFLPVIAENGQ